MVYIRDMIFVKNLERQLNRELREDELTGDSFEVRFPDGTWSDISIPLLRFPHDLLSAWEQGICTKQDVEQDHRSLYGDSSCYEFEEAFEESEEAV